MDETPILVFTDSRDSAASLRCPAVFISFFGWDIAVVFFRNLSVKWKIYFIAIVSILGFGGYLGFNVWVNMENGKLLASLHDVYSPVLEKAKLANINLERIDESLGVAVMIAEADFIDNAKSTADSINKLFNEITILDPSSAGQINTLQKTFGEYFAATVGITEDMISEDADLSEIAARSQNKQELLDKTKELLAAYIKYADAKFTDSISQANANSQLMLNSGFAIWGVCIFIMAITVYAIARIIINNINKVSSSLDTM
ncbi:Hypothetical protein HDN1F_20140 [gamma proteobacterium HdN1]|nr:Hypothetical protein HDN1F_20140 [gamma proteobacterium HdN1]